MSLFAVTLNPTRPDWLLAEECGGHGLEGVVPPLHPTDQSGSSLGVHTEVTSTWRARGVDRGGFPVATLSG